jgi:PAS domain S-box-containing protein
MNDCLSSGRIRPNLVSWENSFEATVDLISIHDRSYRIMKVNKSFARTFGVEQDAVIGRKCYEIVHGTKKPPLVCPHVGAIREGKACSEEIWKNRLGIFLLVSVSPIFADSGRVIGTIHIARETAPDRHPRPDRQQVAELGNGNGLTPRQRQVLQFLGSGKTVKEIGALLHLSPSTIEFHKRQMMRVVGARTVGELVKRVMLDDFPQRNQKAQLY